MNEIVIKSEKKFLTLNFQELLTYRDLFYIFAWRDITVRYKQTIVGVLWVLFQPLATMAVFTFFFSKLASIQTGGLPYFLFVLVGLVFWNYFSNALTHASNSMIDNENIIKKVYFPKVILPFSSAITFFPDFIINFSFLLLLLLLFGFLPSYLSLFIVPLALLITGFTVVGLGMFLSAFNVRYRDVRFILPFFIQLLLFLTPIIYPTSIASETNRFILSLNPMSGVIESVRIVLSGNNNLNYIALFISFFSSLFCFLVGLFYFKKTERFFADIV